MKIENVIMLNNIKQLFVLEDEGLAALVKKENSYSNVVKEKCIEMVNGINTIDRIYFGCEFCDRLIPTLNDIKKVNDYCLANGYKFSLVLPYVTEEKLEDVETILNTLNELNDNIEIICNDWGLVYIIHSKYKNLVIVLGRLLDKMSKDARLSDYQYNQIFKNNSLDYLTKSNLEAYSYIDVLDKYNINRVEFDCPPQGLKLGQKEKAVKVSIYTPFGFITTGRMCMFRFLGQTGKEKYSLENPCTHECLRYNQIMKKMKNCQFNENGKLSLENTELYRKGNTIFYFVNNFDKILEMNPYISRVIYQVGIHS